MQTHIAAGMLALALGAIPALAQSSQTAPPLQSGEKPAQKPQEKTKKVWTDENIAELRSVNITTASATPAAEGAASEEAGAAATPGAAAAAPGKDKNLPPEKTAKYYQAKLAPLRKQLADTEQKIREIQGALDNPYQGTNKIGLGQSAPPGPPQNQPGTPPRADDSIYGNQTVKPKDQLAYFEKQRDDLQQKIDDLEAQAISNGLTRGEIQ